MLKWTEALEIIASIDDCKVFDPEFLRLRRDLYLVCIRYARICTSLRPAADAEEHHWRCDGRARVRGSAFSYCKAMSRYMYAYGVCRQ